MANPWDNDPIVEEAPKVVQPWHDDPIVEPVNSEGPPAGFGKRSDREANDADMRKSEYLADAVKSRIQQDQASPMAQVDAYVRGAAGWIPGVDKLAAAGDAAFGAGKGDNFGDRYSDNLMRQRATDDADSALFKSRLAGQAGGFLPTAMALPVAEVAQGVGRGAQAINAGLTGLGYGAVTGAIENDGGVLDKTQAALTTGALGGIAGAVAPSAIGAVGAGITGAGNLLASAARPLTGTIRGAIAPETEALNRVQRAFSRDGVTNPTDELTRLQSTGADAVVGDVGGENVRALARSSANLSPEARTLIDDATIERGRDQGPRIVEQIRKGGEADSFEKLDALQTAARAANKPAYAQAYADGEIPMWSETLSGLAQAPAMQEAFKAAIKSGANRTVAEGLPPIRTPFGVDDAGNLVLKKNADGSVPVPNLRFWDEVQRDLRKTAEVAKRKGDNETPAVLNDLRRQLLAELDNSVPAFKDARQGAAKAFGAQDALEAGEIFAGSKMKNSEAAAALAKMKPEDRALFQEGYRSNLVDRVKEMGDNRDLSRALFNSPAARERNIIALGKEEAGKLEATMKVEQTLSLFQKAMGNSTTARQLVELGLANGAGTGAVGGGLGYIQGGWSGAAAGAAAGAGLKKGRTIVDTKLARQIGEILTSGDPKKIESVIQAASKNSSFMNAIDALADNASATIGANNPVKSLPFGTKPVSAEEDQGQKKK